MKEKKLERLSPHLFLVGIVAIVAIVALVLHSNGMTGAQIYPQSYKTQIDYNGDCLDDDPEDDYYIAGTAKVNKVQYSDYCEDESIHQFYCTTSSTVRRSPVRICAHGCENGACLEG